MIGLFCVVVAVLGSPFKSKLRLEAENAVLRHQLIVLRRGLHGRVRLTNPDRWFFVELYRWFPSILKVLTIIRPETLVRWHKAAFAATGVGSRAREASRETQRLEGPHGSTHVCRPAPSRPQNCMEAFCGSCPHGQMIELRVAAMRGPCCTSPAIGNLCKQASGSNKR